MAAKFPGGIDGTGSGQLLNIRLQQVAGDPSSPVNGQIWHDTATDKVKIRRAAGTQDLHDALTLGGNAASFFATASALSTLSSTVTSHTSNTSNPHSVTKTQVGLGNVDNTSDANKPVSTAQQTALDLKANAANAALTGTPTAPTAAQGTNTTQIATTAFTIAEIAARLAAADAMRYMGAIDASANPNYPAANAGDTYRISVAGRIGGGSGAVVEVGDFIMSHTDASAGGTQAQVGADWDIFQTNIDGAVTLTGTQTLTNKTLTSPVINSPTGITSTDVTEGTRLYFTVARVRDEVETMLETGTHSGITFVRSGDVINATVTAGGTVGKYTALFGDGAATSFTITQATHGRAANASNLVNVTDATTGEVIYPDVVVAPATGNVTISGFGTAPASNAYRVTILG